MTSQRDREHRDVEWERNVDQLIILMSLCIAKLEMKRWKGKKRIGEILEARIDQLIERYREPHAD